MSEMVGLGTCRLRFVVGIKFYSAGPPGGCFKNLTAVPAAGGSIHSGDVVTGFAVNVRR